MKQVLVVDDSSASLELTRALLLRPRVKLHLAASGAEALDIHRRERVDLIFLDLHMPVVDGAQVCRSIREDPSLKTVSIVMMSESDDAEDRRRSRAAGANDFLVKPASRSDLLRMLYRYLNIAPRRALTVPLQMQVVGHPDFAVLPAETVNVSTSGLLANTKSPVDLGATVICHYQLPEEPRPLLVTGEVVRCESASVDERTLYGVRFLRADAQSLHALERFVEGAA